MDSEEEERLCEACRKGNLKEVQRLVEERGVSVETETRYGWKPIIFATVDGHVDVVRYLLQRGAKVDTKDHGGFTALTFAAIEGHLDIAKLLVEYGSECINEPDEGGWTPLLLAVMNQHSEVVRWLIEMGADVNTKASDGSTPLLQSCKAALVDVETVKALVVHGADVNAADKDGSTPLMALCAQGEIHSDLVIFLVQEHGADVNAVDQYGRTALMILCASKSPSADLIKFLVDNGSNVTAADRDGRTLLILLCSMGFANACAVKILVDDLSTDVNARDAKGETALLSYCRSRNVELEVLQILMNCGADVNAAAQFGQTALMHLCQSENASILLVKFLVENCGADVNAADNEDNTALMHLWKSGSAFEDISQTLVLRHNADVNAVDKNGQTLLMRLCERGQLKVKTVKFLVETLGADVNATAKDGSTALMVAAEKGDPDLVRLLINLNATLNTTDQYNRTARDYAVRSGHRQVQELLIKAIEQHPLSFFKGEPPRWLIRATEIEVGEFSSTKSIGGDFLGSWLDSSVVLKLYDATSAVDISFTEQARRWYSLRHPNIQKLYGAVHEGYQMFVCEYMSYGSLRDYVEEHKTHWTETNVANAVRYLHEAALGLQFLHERGIIHGDIRPENVLIGSDGIASLANVCMTDNNELINQQAEEKVSRELDVMFFGGLMYDVLADTDEFLSLDSDEEAGLMDIVEEDPQNRCAINSVVVRLKQLSNKLKSSEPHHIHQVSPTEIASELDKLRETVDDVGISIYKEIFGVLETICGRVLSPNVPVNEEVLVVLKTIERAIDRQLSRSNNPIQRLSSCRPADSSLDFFRKQMERLLDVLVAPREVYDELQQRLDSLYKLKIEVFVSEVDHTLTLLRPTNVEDLVVLLHKELHNQSKRYTPTQLEVIQKAYDDAMSEQLTEVSESLPEWFIGWYELENEETIARGGFGEVSKAKWLNSDVIVKRMIMDESNGNNRAQRQMFKHEVNLWFGLNHPHVVKLFGGCHIGAPFFVCEEAKHGVLDKYLKKHPAQVWQKLYEAALGLEYLHSRGMVHRDIKCDNILVGSDGNAKLADFGLSALAHAENQGATTGATRWVAPECLKGEQATFASDIFSLGMCIIQVVTGDLPWGRTRDNNAVKYHVLQQKLPEGHSRFTDSQWHLVESMCKYEPSERLNILVIVQRLKQFADNPEVVLTTPAPVTITDSIRDTLRSMRRVLSPLKDEPSKQAVYHAYNLLVDRFEDLYSGHFEMKLKCSLDSIVLAASNLILELPEQELTVDFVKALFRGFSLHRDVDRVLAENFVKPSSGDQKWSEKWSTSVRSGCNDVK